MSAGSVVTAERFAKGFTFKDYVAAIKVNRDRYEHFYNSFQLSPEDKTFFEKAGKTENGIGRLLAIAEDWCPDAFRGVPVMARIAEAAGAEMRIFPRDQNLDIMNEFLNQGKFMSIPVAVFFTSGLKEIGRWVERPQVAYRERAEIEAAIKKEMPNATESDFRLAIRDRTQPRYPAWQQETVREMRQTLAAKLGL